MDVDGEQKKTVTWATQEQPHEVCLHPTRPDDHDSNSASIPWAAAGEAVRPRRRTIGGVERVGGVGRATPGAGRYHTRVPAQRRRT